MTRHGILTLAILIAVVAPARAADIHGAGRGLVPMPPVSHPGNRPPFQHHPFNRRPFFPYWGMTAYVPPVSYVTYVPVPVYEPLVVYSQPVDSAPSLELGPPPMPSVIPYPDGRYVLMGDGVTLPYKWVWIPNPPSGPPAAPAAPQPVEPAASRGAGLYRWVDDQDVVHFTQGWDAVPERYRAQVKLLGAP